MESVLARFYDPQVGRFISQDSYLGQIDDPPSLHRYFYANDNPTRYVDPTGHAPEESLAEIAERLGRVNKDIRGMDDQGRIGADTAPVTRERYYNNEVQDARTEEMVRLDAQEFRQEQAWRDRNRPKVVVEDKSVLRKLIDGDYEEQIKAKLESAARAKAENELKPAEHGAFENRRRASEGAGVEDPGTPNIAGGLQTIGGDVAAAGALGLTTVAIEGGKFAVLDGAGKVIGEFADAARAERFIARERTLAVEEGVAYRAKGGTYVLKDAESEEVLRTGRSKDLHRRELEHARRPGTRDLKFDVDKRTDVYEEQRGREQVIHEKYGKPPLNKVEPISPSNPNRDKYLEAAKRFENEK